MFSDLAPMISFFAEGLPELSEESFDLKKLELSETKKYLQFILWRLDAHSDWRRDALNQLFIDLAADLDVKIRDLLAPVFVAISGKSVTPPLFDSMAIIGPDLSRARIRHALDALGGVSKKQAKSLEKEYRLL